MMARLMIVLMMQSPSGDVAVTDQIYQTVDQVENSEKYFQLSL